MKKAIKKKAARPRRAAISKRKHRLTLNPAEHRLTGAEYRVYQIVELLQGEGRTITSGIVAKKWGWKNRSYTYRVLKSLMDKGIIEQYSQRYYRLVK